MANIVIKDVGISPNPVHVAEQLMIEVSVEYHNPSGGNFACVGSYVGSFVNIGRDEISAKMPLAFVGDYVKK